MKKGIIFTALAVAALSVTSCAPTISVEQARVEANDIQAHYSAQNEDYKGGTALEVNYYIIQEAKMDGMVERVKSSGKIQFHVENYYMYGVFENEEYIKVPGIGEEKITEKTEVSAGFKDSSTYVLSSKSYSNGEVISDVSESISMADFEVRISEIESTIKETYATINGVFSTAVNAILQYVNYNQAILDQLGIKLGSYGAGSLVITEDVKQGTASSHTVVEFKDYKLQEMYSKINATQNGATVVNELKYTFNYNFSTKLPF